MARPFTGSQGRAGLLTPWDGGEEEDEHSSCSSQELMEQVPRCCAVTARCAQSMGMMLCLCFPPHCPGTEHFHRASLQPESPDFPVFRSKTHTTVSGTSDVEGEEGWGWVSPRPGELLGALGLGCPLGLCPTDWLFSPLTPA